MFLPLTSCLASAAARAWNPSEFTLRAFLSITSVIDFSIFVCRSDKPFINKFDEIPFEQKIGNVTWGRHFWNIWQTFTSLRPFLEFSLDSWMIALIWLLYYSQNKYALAWVEFGNIGDWFQAVCIWLASIESGIYKFEASAIDVDVVVISDICHSKCDNKFEVIVWMSWRRNYFIYGNSTWCESIHPCFMSRSEFFTTPTCWHVSISYRKMIE